MLKNKTNVVIEYYPGTNIKKSEKYLVDKKLHRENGPAKIIYDNNGKVVFEFYCLDNIIYRENGPCKVWYHEDGSLFIEHYFQESQSFTHEVFLNCTKYNYIEIEYDKGLKKIEKYFITPNFYHRPDGPAYIEYDSNGNIINKKYFLCNVLLPEVNNDQQLFERIKKDQIISVFK